MAENWINDEIFQSWINRTTEPNKISLYDRLAKEAFDLIPVGPNACESCPFLYESKDAYMTGDSPSEFICKGNSKDCPREEDIKDFVEAIIIKKLNKLAESDLALMIESLKEGDQFSYASLFVQILMKVEP